MKKITEKILLPLHTIKDFFDSLHPIVVTLILMLMISVPITLVSSALDKGVNRDSRAGTEQFFEENKMSDIAWDIIIKTPIKEEGKYRSAIAIISLLKPVGFLKAFITLENPLIWFIIILPGINWAQPHAIPLAALFDSLLLGWLVFKIGGWRGWLAALLVHVLINFAVFIGFAMNSFIK